MMEDALTAKGTFEVKLTPQPLSYDAGGAPLGRVALAKQFHGDLTGTSNAEMLTGGNPGSGSAGYVAIEHVSGALHGRSGTFILQHSGTLDAGAPSLSVTVVPASGTGELAGIRGTMTIDPATHAYDFEYTLP